MIEGLRSEVAGLKDQIALLHEEAAQLRDVWKGPSFLPPEWGLSPKEHDFVMTLYRKRGVFLDRHRLLTSMYGTAPEVGPDIINTYAAHVRKKLRLANAVVQIESYGRENIGGYRLSAASLNELDYLLEISTKPIRFQRHR